MPSQPQEPTAQPASTDPMPYVVNDQDFKELMDLLQSTEVKSNTIISYMTGSSVLVAFVIFMELLLFAMQLMFYLYPVSVKRYCIPTPREVERQALRLSEQRAGLGCCGQGGGLEWPAKTVALP